jgi:hypothetical protein
LFSKARWFCKALALPIESCLEIWQQYYKSMPTDQYDTKHGVAKDEISSSLSKIHADVSFVALRHDSSSMGMLSEIEEHYIATNVYAELVVCYSSLCLPSFSDANRRYLVRQYGHFLDIAKILIDHCEHGTYNLFQHLLCQ